MNNPQGSEGSLLSQKIFHNSKDPPLFFIMMRLNVKVALLVLVMVTMLMVFSLWSMCSEPPDARIWQAKVKRERSKELIGTEIDCDINGEYVVSCRKEGDETYVPASFLRKYFEVYGKVIGYDGIDKYEWFHSYSKVYRPKGKYDPRGVFMYFENYNVEVRDRVKCISAIDGVPISTQWGNQGYYYPTQIAQFGLSHYSKNLTEPEPRRKILDNSVTDVAKWVVHEGAELQRTFDAEAESRVLSFKTGDRYSESIELKMNHVLDFVLGVSVKLSGNSSISVTLQHRELNDVYNLHYLSSNILITAQDNNIYHGIGTTYQWKRLTRDLIVDLQKGQNYLVKTKSKHKIPRSKLRIVSIVLHGEGSIDNLTLSSTEHMEQFYNAAEWFVKNQDPKTGGWAIPVKRPLAIGFDELKPGWYSAMGQGHALSILARAYYHSRGDQRYLDAALKGLKLFLVPSSKGGVLTTFLDKYKWYEEYPTNPSSFVLNGFIYSLLGLYDLMEVTLGQSNLARSLYYDGLASLKRMLTLYDMGSVTAYDLRHFTLGIAPNLARWDYHATHVNQLLLLNTIENEPLFFQTAERWIGYMSGKRAAHN